MDTRRRPLALLATLFVLAAQAGATRADSLVSSLASDTRPGAAFRVGVPNSPIAFRSGRRGEEDEANEEATEADPDQVLQVLAVILAVPAGTTPTVASSTEGGNTVVKTSSGGQNNGGDGEGGHSGGSNNLAPEPGSLFTALIGSALSGLALLRRRHRRRMRPTC